LSLDQHGSSVLAKACIQICRATVTFEDARKQHDAKAKTKTASAKAKVPKEKTNSELARALIFTKLEPMMIAQMKKLGYTEAGLLPVYGKFKNLKTKKILVPVFPKMAAGCGYEEKKEERQSILGCGHKGSENPRDKCKTFQSRIYCTNINCSHCPMVNDNLNADDVKVSTILEWRVDFEDLDKDGEVYAVKGTARGDYLYPHNTHGRVPSSTGLGPTRQEAIPFDEDFVLQGVYTKFLNHITENYKDIDNPPPGIQITNHMKGDDLHPHDHRLMEYLPSCRREYKPLIEVAKHREALLRLQVKFINDHALADQFTHYHCVPRTILGKGSREDFFPTWPINPKQVPHLYFDSVMALMDGSQRVDGDIPSNPVPDPVPQPYHDDIAPVTLQQIIDLLPPVGHVMLQKDKQLYEIAVGLGLKVSKGKDGNAGKFYLPPSIKKRHAKDKVFYKVNENPFLKETGLFLPGTIIFPLQDYRRIRFPQGNEEIKCSLKRKHYMYFAGNVTHAGDTYAPEEIPPWHIAVHIYVNSIFHPRLPNTFSYNYDVIAKFQSAHVSSFKVDEQSKALKSANDNIIDLYSQTLLNPKALQTGFKNGKALVKAMNELIEKADKQMKDLASAKMLEDHQEEEDEVVAEEEDSSYNDADGDDSRKPAAVPESLLGKRNRKEKVKNDLGYAPPKEKKSKQKGHAKSNKDSVEIDEEEATKALEESKAAKSEAGCFKHTKHSMKKKARAAEEPKVPEEPKKSKRKTTKATKKATKKATPSKGGSKGGSKAK